MKLKSLFLSLFILVVLAGNLFAAGTCTESYDDIGGTFIVTMTCVADAAAATYPNTSFSGTVMNRLKCADGSCQESLRLKRVVTDPGSTAPTADSDIQLQDEASYDVLGGAGTDEIDASSVLEFYPTNTDGLARYYPVTATSLTQVISNNAVNSANLVIKYYFER